MRMVFEAYAVLIGIPSFVALVLSGLYFWRSRSEHTEFNRRQGYMILSAALLGVTVISALYVVLMLVCVATPPVTSGGVFACPDRIAGMLPRGSPPLSICATGPE